MISLYLKTSQIQAGLARSEAVELKDLEASLPFALLGLDSDNGGEFLNYHVLHWLQKRP